MIKKKTQSAKSNKISEKKIALTVKNKWLDFLEDLLTVELTPDERKKATKECMKLLTALVTAYDK
jgi:hypothetical protein